MLPNTNGEIDWDVVADNYHDWILSPYAPLMTEPGPNGRCRNRLLDYLRDVPDRALMNMAVADFGCGPGNLVPHLAGRVKRLTCVDISRTALDKAGRLAGRHGVEAELVYSDIGMLDASCRYDLIVSVNAILPPARVQVHRMLAAVRRCLKPGGRFAAILPSFDTTEYLRELWREHYRRTGLDKAGVEAKIAAFEQSRKMDARTLSYADDGHNRQCYHTAQSIAGEFSENGLRLAREPVKVYYPWELVRRFGYGYFPDSGEEIWDWFVVAAGG